MNSKVKKVKNKIPNGVVIILILLGLVSFNGCYYDSEEELYPQAGSCDTTNVTYSGTISQIMSGNCNSCHSGSAPESNVKTDNYTDLKTIADNGKLWGVVNHENGFSQMPKDLPKLSDCDLSKIRIWIDGGALNN
jgi:hypothetical protein